MCELCDWGLVRVSDLVTIGLADGWRGYTVGMLVAVGGKGLVRVRESCLLLQLAISSYVKCGSSRDHFQELPVSIFLIYLLFSFLVEYFQLT